jgi:hypothetical protein
MAEAKYGRWNVPKMVAQIEAPLERRKTLSEYIKWRADHGLSVYAARRP